MQILNLNLVINGWSKVNELLLKKWNELIFLEKVSLNFVDEKNY